MKLTPEQFAARERRQWDTYRQPKCSCGNVLGLERTLFGPNKCRGCLSDELVGCKINEQEKVMIDWTKPIETTDGRPARYIGRLERTKCPNLVATPGSTKEVMRGFEEGVRGVDDLGNGVIASFGIRNVPPKPRRGFILVPAGIDTWGMLYNSVAPPPGYERVEVVEVLPNG